MKAAVIIPTYKPDEKFLRLLEMLSRQTCQAEKILILNTEKKYWKESWLEGLERAEVRHISREEFDHGKTRAMGADMTDSEFLVYFTQDAVPADEYVLERLLEPFEDSQVAAVYGRQLPDRDCKIIERYIRTFNYPEESRKKTKADLKNLGIKTYFCSNVCAAYRKSAYREAGGFPVRTIFNEDMILAAKMIQAGRAVVYAAEARVIHSHNYGWIQQFKRNFDLAVSQADHPEIFRTVSSESEGMRLVKETASYLVSIGKPWLIFQLVMSSGFKFLGYQAGKQYQKLPAGVIKKFTMNPAYWEKL